MTWLIDVLSKGYLCRVYENFCSSGNDNCNSNNTSIWMMIRILYNANKLKGNSSSLALPFVIDSLTYRSSLPSFRWVRRIPPVMQHNKIIYLKPILLIINNIKCNNKLYLIVSIIRLCLPHILLDSRSSHHHSRESPVEGIRCRHQTCSYCFVRSFHASVQVFIK